MHIYYPVMARSASFYFSV